MWNNYIEIPSFIIDLDHSPIQEDNVEAIKIGVEIPYWDEILSIADSYGPNSYEKAFQGIFDTCHVAFMNAGDIEVAWNKAKFKKKWEDFVTARKELEPERKHFQFEITPRNAT